MKKANKKDVKGKLINYRSEFNNLFQLSIEWVTLGSLVRLITSFLMKIKYHYVQSCLSCYSFHLKIKWPYKAYKILGLILVSIEEIPLNKQKLAVYCHRITYSKVSSHIYRLISYYS